LWPIKLSRRRRDKNAFLNFFGLVLRYPTSDTAFLPESILRVGWLAQTSHLCNIRTGLYSVFQVWEHDLSPTLKRRSCLSLEWSYPPHPGVNCTVLEREWHEGQWYYILISIVEVQGITGNVNIRVASSISVRGFLNLTYKDRLQFWIEILIIHRFGKLFTSFSYHSIRVIWWFISEIVIVLFVHIQFYLLILPKWTIVTYEMNHQICKQLRKHVRKTLCIQPKIWKIWKRGKWYGSK